MAARIAVPLRQDQITVARVPASNPGASAESDSKAQAPSFGGVRSAGE